MSYVALASDRYEAVVRFYTEGLGFRAVAAWDRPGARGMRLWRDGLGIEILDNLRLKSPLSLFEPGDRMHLVIEVDDLETVRADLHVDAGPIEETSWGARLLKLRDPDNVAVAFLQWTLPQS